MTTTRGFGRPVRHRTLLPAAALAGLVLAAGCGSGGTATSSAGGGAAASTASYPTVDVVSSIAADPKLHAELPAAVRAQGTLTLGTTLQPGTGRLPYSGETPSGQSVGVEVDLRDAVARLLGIRWQAHNGTFDTIVPGVQNGTYDVGDDNFSVTAAREEVVDFSTYLTDGQSFLAPSDSKLSHVTTDITDLCGLTIATSPGTTFQQILTDDAKKCTAAGKKPYTVQLFADDAPIWLGLANGKVDIYFGPTIGLHYDVTRIPNTKFLGQFNDGPIGFVTRRNSPLAKPLTDAVNELIANGDYARILRKWGLTAAGISKSLVNPKPTF